MTEFHTRQLLNSDPGLHEWLTGKGYSDADAHATNAARNAYARSLGRLSVANATVNALYALAGAENSISCTTEEYKEVCMQCNAAVAKRDELYELMTACDERLSAQDVDDAINILERVSTYENWKG